MPEIPLFDSLTHPTITGDWILPRYPRRAQLTDLEDAMASSGVRWALAVGMKGIGGYEEAEYARYIKSSSKRLFPVAFFDFKEGESREGISSKLTRIKECGYIGIKLHPRLSQISLTSQTLRWVMASAASEGLCVLLCTYFHGPDCVAAGAHIADLPALLADIPGGCRLVLLHGGTVDLLRVSEMTRAYANVLLDLSFTLCRFEGSSLDQDIAYLFRSYDQRVCVGSDNPQYDLASLRRRFEHFAATVSTENALNIAHRNLLTLIGAQASGTVA